MYLNFCKLLFLSCCVCFLTQIQAQNIAPSIEAKLSFVYGVPVGPMAVNMNHSSGAALEVLYTPENSIFSYGLDLGVAEYGLHREIIDYRLDEQTQVETDMRVMNCYTFLNLVGRMNLLKKGKVVPYLQTKLGANYFWTGLRIDDPDSDHEDCPDVLERSTLSQALVLSSTVGMGIRADLVSLFTPSDTHNSFNLDIQVNYTYGSRFRHMNTARIFVPISPSPEPDQSAAKNASPTQSALQEVNHEYYQGNTFLSPLRMIDIRLGLSVIF